MYIIDDNIQVSVEDDTVVCQIFDRVSHRKIVQASTIWRKNIPDYYVKELRPLQTGYFTEQGKPIDFK